MLANLVLRDSESESTFFLNNIYAFFYLRRVTIIATHAIQTQGYRNFNNRGICRNIEGLSRQIGWFYRQLMCSRANLVLYFPVNSHAQQKFPYSI